MPLAESAAVKGVAPGNVASGSGGALGEVAVVPPVAKAISMIYYVILYYIMIYYTILIQVG